MVCNHRHRAYTARTLNIFLWLSNFYRKLTKGKAKKEPDYIELDASMCGMWLVMFIVVGVVAGGFFLKGSEEGCLKKRNKFLQWIPCMRYILLCCVSIYIFRLGMVLISFAQRHLLWNFCWLYGKRLAYRWTKRVESLD